MTALFAVGKSSDAATGASSAAGPVPSIGAFAGGARSGTAGGFLLSRAMASEKDGLSVIAASKVEMPWSWRPASKCFTASCRSARKRFCPPAAACCCSGGRVLRAMMMRLCVSAEAFISRLTRRPSFNAARFLRWTSS